MTEKRLLDGAGTDLENALLNSARHEVPSNELSAKMMAPVSAGGATGAGTGSLLKWGLGAASAVFAVGAVVIWGASGMGDGHQGEQPKRHANVGVESTDDAVTPVGAGKEPSAEALPSPSAPAEPSEASPAETATSHQAVSTSRPKAAESTLGAEMHLLDQARSALKAGTPDEALRLLSTYDSRYPKGTLRPEATVLRVKALKETGAQGEATELKKEFLRTHPQSAHKTRLEKKENASP